MIFNDRRTPAQRETHKHLVVGTDRFLSGWGHARGGTSIAVWACETFTDAMRVASWARERGDQKRVRVVYEGRRRYRPKRAAHVSIYVVEPGHPGLGEEAPPPAPTLANQRSPFGGIVG